MAGEDIIRALMAGSPAQTPTQQPLTQRDMYQYIARTPELSNQWTPFANAGPSRPMDANAASGRMLSEAAAAQDPLMMTAIQRMLGFPVDPRVQMNEAHGIANQQQYYSR